jgi:hypothetical protein
MLPQKQCGLLAGLCSSSFFQVWITCKLTPKQMFQDAQRQYFNQIHDGDNIKQYAQKIVSDEGKHNGLYWNVAEGETPSPLGQLGDFAKAVGYTNAGNKPQPFNGYYFQILTKQGDKAPGGAKDYIANGKMTGGFWRKSISEAYFSRLSEADSESSQVLPL